MALADRIRLIRRIQEIRGSHVICYLTSVRPNVNVAMAEDAVRVIFEHLLLIPNRPVPKLDIFLCSNGGHATVPWRLVSLFREFSASFSVLIPYRAYSAATLLALGADEIVMHPFGELGPIDPTVSNEFNPTHPHNGQPIGISVEDVKAYVNFIKSTVGINHEDELVQAIAILAEKVHPLALGNVERFISESRMIATKILRTHSKPLDEHIINEIVENMASKLYFHGHPINRKEAKDDLGLKVESSLSPELETVMWTLYKDYEEEMDNREVFDPAMDLAGIPPTAQVPEKQYDLVLAMVESTRLASACHSQQRFRLFTNQQTGQPSLQGNVLSIRWTSVPVQEEQPELQESPTPDGDAQHHGNGQQFAQTT